MHLTQFTKISSQKQCNKKKKKGQILQYPEVTKYGEKIKRKN